MNVQRAAIGRTRRADVSEVLWVPEEDDILARVVGEPNLCDVLVDNRCPHASTSSKASHTASTDSSTQAAQLMAGTVLDKRVYWL